MEIETTHQEVSGLITRFKEELDNPDAQEIMVRMLSTEIMTLFGDMEDFLIRVDEFLKKFKE